MRCLTSGFLRPETAPYEYITLRRVFQLGCEAISKTSFFTDSVIDIQGLSWKVDSYLAGQISCHYGILSLLLYSALDQPISVHVFTFCFLRFIFNIIVSSRPTPGSPTWSLPFRFNPLSSH